MFVFFIIQTLVMLLLSFLFSLFFPRISNVRPLFRSPPHSAFVPQKLKVDFRRYVRILYHSDSGNAAPLLPLLSVLPPHLQRKTCKFFLSDSNVIQGSWFIRAHLYRHSLHLIQGQIKGVCLVGSFLFFHGRITFHFSWRSIPVQNDNQFL